MDQIDKYLDAVNLLNGTSPSDYFLKLHIDVYPVILSKLKSEKNFDGSVVRYREFLLIFDEYIIKGLMVIGLIEDEINNLIDLHTNTDRIFTLKENHTLKYLIRNRIIYKFGSAYNPSNHFNNLSKV